MFTPKELDLRNNYNPNLQDMQVSAEITYAQGNEFYEIVVDGLKKLEDRFKSGEYIKESEIYVKSNTIASILAESCEMYLKAIYIYENNIPSSQIDEIWEKLKKNEFKKDQQGNLIYKTSSGEITFVKYDQQGNPIKDEDGKIIYFDKNNNTYDENSRGAKIKRNGHQLDRLIENLSPITRLLLDKRILTISMESTEKNQSVSIIDVLVEKGVFSLENQISLEEYEGRLDQHSKTFEETRYAGEKKYDINVEFLFHLATQLKAVTQYKINPTNNQNFTITDKEFEQLPEELKQMALSHPRLMSDDLIKLIANDNQIKNKIIQLFYNTNFIPPENISSVIFYKMIKLMNFQEIAYLSILFFMFRNYDEIKTMVSDESVDKLFKEIFEVVQLLKINRIESTEFITLLVALKEAFGGQISIDNMKDIIKLYMEYKKNIEYTDNIKNIEYTDNIKIINNINHK